MAKGDISTELKRILQEKNYNWSIDIDEIVNEIRFTADLSHLTIRDLQDAYIRQVVSVLLNDYGYSSIKYGKGVWINPEWLMTGSTQKEAFARLLNKKMDAEDAAHLLVGKIKEKAKILKGQMTFDFAENRYVVEMDDEELIETLRRMAANE